MTSAHADQVFEIAADLFGVLSSSTRLRIVCALMDGEKNVTELIERVALTQPNMSQHLGSLYRGGVLSRRRNGSQIFYGVRHAQVRAILQAMPVCAEHTAVTAPARRRPTPMI